MKPPEEVRREHVRQWLARADEDYGLAEQLVLGNSPYVNSICFHAQQAAEKYLKALLVNNQVEFPKTHDIVKILDLLASVDKDLAESLREVKILSDYGVDVRYPGDLPELTSEEARDAFILAQKVRDAVMLKL